MSLSVSTTAVDVIRSAIAAVRPAMGMRVDEWAEKNLILSARNSPIDGPLRFIVTPYLRFIVNRFINPIVRRIKLAFGAQAGKTTCVFCMLGYVIDQEPGPSMYMGPTKDFTKDVSKDRIQMLIDDCPVLRKHKTGRDDDFQLLMYTLDRMTVYFAWSHSETAMRSHPIKNLFKDEMAAYAPGASAEADDRVKAYWNHKIVETSTPVEERDPFWNSIGLKRKADFADSSGEELWNISAWEPDSTTTVWLYYVKCVHCKKPILFEWKNIRWPKDCAIRELDDKGWYECPECGGKITDGDKLRMVREAGDDGWTALNPGGQWETFYLPSMYAPWDTCRFGAMAAAYIRAKISGDPENVAKFVRSFLALPCSMMDLGTALVTKDAIETAANAAGAYQRNQIATAIKALVVGVDYRATQVHYVVIGIGPASEIWVVTWGILGMGLEELKGWILSSFWTHPTAGNMRICAGAIDGRFRPHEVKEFCRKWPLFKVVLGEDEQAYIKSRALEPHRVTVLDKDVKGKNLPGGMQGYLLNTSYWKRFLYYRINRRDENDPVLMHFPVDRDEEFDRHLQSEREIVRPRRGGGQPHRTWITRRGYEANHYLDAIVYALGMAFIRGLFKLPDASDVIKADHLYAPAMRQPDVPSGGRVPDGDDRPWIDPSRINFRRK